MFSNKVSTILGAVNASITFVLTAVASGQVALDPMVVLGIGAVGAALNFLVGNDHPGN